MAKYSFRLASLLRLREATRDDCRQALAQVLREDDQLVERLTEVRTKLTVLRADGHSALRPGLLNVERLRDAPRYERSLRTTEAEILDQRLQLAGEVDRRRTALVSADTEVRALEKLRETGIQRHHQEQARAEIQELDEVALRQTADKLS